MIHSVTLADLRAIDSPEAWRPDMAEEARLLDRVQRAGRRLARETGQPWTVDDPSAFQDGALFTHLWTGAPASPCSILISGFGGLMTTTGFGQPACMYSADQVESFTRLLADDYGFRFVAPALLDADYDGPFTKYTVGTWGQRFFCSVYWAARRLGPLR